MLKMTHFSKAYRATYADFFPMFETPFLVGGAWSAVDDKNHADVADITQKMNDKVFGGGNSVGKTIKLDNHDFRIVGVLGLWAPTPQFYDLNNNAYGEGAEVYIPFTRAIDGPMASWGNNNCNGDVGQPGWQGRLRSECVWLQFWAELPTAADVAAYRAFLNNYASEQQRSGRFHWPAHTKIRDVREWLV